MKKLSDISTLGYNAEHQIPTAEFDGFEFVLHKKLKGITARV